MERDRTLAMLMQINTALGQDELNPLLEEEYALNPELFQFPEDQRTEIKTICQNLGLEYDDNQLETASTVMQVVYQSMKDGDDAEGHQQLIAMAKKVEPNIEAIMKEHEQLVKKAKEKALLTPES